MKGFGSYPCDDSFHHVPKAFRPSIRSRFSTLFESFIYLLHSVPAVSLRVFRERQRKLLSAHRRDTTQRHSLLKDEQRPHVPWYMRAQRCLGQRCASIEEKWETRSCLSHLSAVRKKANYCSDQNPSPILLSCDHALNDSSTISYQLLSHKAGNDQSCGRNLAAVELCFVLTIVGNFCILVALSICTNCSWSAKHQPLNLT